MQYRIVEKEGFTVVGLKEFTTTEDGQNFQNIPKMWDKLPKETFMELFSLSDSEPSGVLGICADMYDGGFDYWIAAATTKHCPPTFQSLDIPACTWAVFETTGPMPEAIQELFVEILTKWLPESEYVHAPVPEIEWYSEGDIRSPAYKSAVWLPVEKK